MVQTDNDRRQQTLDETGLYDPRELDVGLLIAHQCISAFLTGL